MFEHKVQNDLAIAEFAPLVRCKAEAAKAQLVARAVSRAEAEKAHRRGEEQAITRYLRLCAQIDPDDADTTDEEAIFRFLAEPE